VKEEPEWIRDFRLKALDTFLSEAAADPLGQPRTSRHQLRQNPLLPRQGPAPKRSWDEVPEDVKRTFERLGIPEQERKFLAGVEAQFDSEAVYSNIKKAVGEQGVIFTGSTEGLKKHPEIFRKWFGKVIPTGRQQILRAQLSAVFSGGSFIYVPPG
jgi:Fe-S cluster assembly protein SufB